MSLILQRRWALPAASLAAAAALRIPLRPQHLFSEDCINFAEALERFDPVRLSPQPPGYPLFVLQSQAIHAVVPSVETTFLVGVILGTAASLYLVARLARELSGTWRAGVLAAVLLVVNPAFLYTGLTSTIRVYLAAVTLAVAFCCWRLWNGGARWWPAAALSFGLGAGYRPELLALLFPLWAASAWRGRRSRREFSLGLLLVALAAGAWIAFLYSRFPTAKSFFEVHTRYLADQSRDYSPLYGAGLEGWLRMLGLLLAWEGVAAAGWLVFLPLARPWLKAGAGWFLALWVAPATLFYALVHIGAGDQALSAIPALCLIGGAVLARVFERRVLAGLAATLAAVTLNLAAFAAPEHLYPRLTPRRPLDYVWFLRKQVADGLWEVSWSAFRNVGRESEGVLAGLGQALSAAPGRPLVVWSESPVTWRKLSYYYPDVTFCLLLNSYSTGNRPHASLWRGARLLLRFDGAPVPVPLAGATRLIWILGREAAVRKALGSRLHAGAPGGIYWTEAVPLEIPGYRFVP